MCVLFHTDLTTKSAGSTSFTRDSAEFWTNVTVHAVKVRNPPALTRSELRLVLLTFTINSRY